jgi:GT2 family glycosyltransferase
MLNKSVDFLAFIDDDILVERDYVSRLMSVLFATEAVGVSGIATNREINKKRLKPFGLSGLIHRIFLLDSKTDGALLCSGINIPIRSERDENLEVDWLIGCSIWRSESIEDLEFERDFKGQSLAEDVIFSVRARKRGKLITNPSVVIDHYESPNERPDKLAHYQMWVVNRKRLITVMGGGFIRRSAFQFANFGQALIFLYLGFRKDKKNFRITFKIINTSFRNL